MNPLRAALLLACLFATLPAAASQDTRQLDAIPMVATDAASVSAAVAIARDIPRRFAVPQPLTLDVADGAWTTDGDHAVWQLRLFSADARQLAVAVSDIRLPDGGRLSWQPIDGGTPGHDFPDHADGLWWSPFVPGAWGLLTATLPAAGRDTFALTVTTVFHAFVGEGASMAKAAGSCNVDVACPQANAWRLQQAATVRLTIANTALCSGTLVSNTANNGRPLILTANHCGITAGNARSTTALFNFERDTCGSGVGGLSDTVEGADLVGTAVEADTALIVLRSRPPAAFGARYSGWNARPTSQGAPQSGAALHHPDGDVKKISLYGTPARAVDNVQIGGLLGGFQSDAWGVRWTQGTTEQGSSGGGLFDQSGLLVGVLSGGTASCSNLDGEDYFGRLERAFSTSSAIANALDPVGNGTARLSSTSNDGGLPALSDGGGGGGGLSLLAGLAAGLWWRRRRAVAATTATSATARVPRRARST